MLTNFIAQIVQCIYEIAEHPGCQQPIRDEIQAALSSNGGVLIRESLLLLPIVSRRSHSVSAQGLYVRSSPPAYFFRALGAAALVL